MSIPIAAATRARWCRRRTRGVLLAYALVAPAILWRTAVAVYPFLHTAIQGFTNESPLTPPTRWVGLRNYHTMFGDPAITESLVFTAIDPVLRACRDPRIPVVVHGAGEWSNMPFQFDEMARTFPDVTIVMAHMGTVWGFQDALVVAERRPNVMLGTALAFSGFVQMAVEWVGADKVLMETDSPVQAFEAEIAKIEIAVPDRAARDLVMGGNIARILRLSL